MEDHQYRVLEFHRQFGLPYPSKPDVGSFTSVRINLIQEELDELKDAWAVGDIIGMIDALCDLEYVVMGAAVALGVDLEPYSKEVHRSNMSKANADGTVTLREDGKVVKSATYSPARIKELYEVMHGA